MLSIYPLLHINGKKNYGSLYNHNTLYNNMLLTAIISCLFSIILQNRYHYYYLFTSVETSTQIGEVMLMFVQ